MGTGYLIYGLNPTVSLEAIRILREDTIYIYVILIFFGFPPKNIPARQFVAKRSDEILLSTVKALRLFVMYQSARTSDSILLFKYDSTLSMVYLDDQYV